MEITINNDASRLEESKELYSLGYKYSSILYLVDINKIDTAYNDAVHFLAHEITRAQVSSLGLLKSGYLTLDIAPLKDPRGFFILEFICPILRVLLEGFIKFRYVSSNGWKNTPIVNEKIAELTNDFKLQYHEYSEAIKKINNQGNPTISSPFQFSDAEIKKLRKSRGERNMWKLLNKTFGKDSHPSNYKSIPTLNSWYQFCCFFSHANLNHVILKSSNLQEFAAIDIQEMIEEISEQYYLSLIYMTDFKNMDLNEQYVKVGGDLNSKYIEAGGIPSGIIG